MPQPRMRTASSADDDTDMVITMDRHTKPRSFFATSRPLLRGNTGHVNTSCEKTAEAQKLRRRKGVTGTVHYELELQPTC